YGLAGGPPEGRRVKCWFPGGSSAPVLTEDDLDLAYDFETMAEAGSMLGSGAIIVIDDSVPIVDVALSVANFYRHESCGKCTPCREGTNWTQKMLERIDAGEATPMDLEVMAQVQSNIIGNCLCVLGDSMAMPIGSMIEKFRPEFEAHMEAARRQRHEELLFDPSALASSEHSGPTPLDPRQGGDGRSHDLGSSQAGAERGRRVPAREPPARLPGLRQGRRVPAAGHLVRLGRGAVALHRAEAPLQEAAGALAARGDRPR